MIKQWKQLKGLTIAYVGDGKGKTTAAVGVAVRALGWGWRVCFFQFMKEEKWPSGERMLFRKVFPLLRGEGEGEVPRIDVEVVGEGFVGIMGDKKERDIHKEAAAKGLARAREVLTSSVYQLVILDEILSAVDEGLLTEQQISDMLDAKSEDMTLVMTGHKSYPKLFERVDLVTEMKKVKHPFDSGFVAKKGIDY